MLEKHLLSLTLAASMKRIALVLGSVVVAAACGGGKGGPTSPTSPTSALGWDGTMKFSGSVFKDGGRETNAWEAKVAWIRDTEDDFLVTPLSPGTVAYKIGNGSIKMTATITAGDCNGAGEKTRELKPDEGFLVVTPNGTYSGYLKETEGFEVTLNCRRGSVPGFPAGNIGTGWLVIRGTVANLRIQGDMEAVNTPINTATGSWDLFQVE